MAIERKIKAVDTVSEDVTIELVEYPEGVVLSATDDVVDGMVTLNISKSDAAVLGKWLQEVSE